MDTIKIIDFWIFMAALVIAGNISKKEPERFKKLMADTLGYVMGVGLVFSLIEFLAGIGFEILDAAWRFTPLDFMSAVSCLFFLAICFEKWSLSHKTSIKWWKC